MTTVVAIVPAKDRADSVAATVRALLALPSVDRVLVVDDGSADATAVLAQGAGAHVLRLPLNRGKGGAVLAGVAAAADADVFLLIDADLATTAGAAELLLDPVLADDADLTIGVLPPAGGRGGFGKVRDLTRRGIRRACGLDVRAPLSGQRAARADLLRGLVDAERFGLEVAMTIEAHRQGARVLEVDVPMDHRHTGRSVAGFRHRAGQGLDIVRALWPRLTSARQRRALILGAAVVAVVASSFLALGARPSADHGSGRAQRVVVFGIPRIGLEDLRSEDAPNLARLAHGGAVAAMSVRTLRERPASTDAYATISAGARVEASRESSLAVDGGDSIEGSTAREVTERRTGRPADGEVVVIGAAATIRGAGDDVSSEPGALGDVLADANLRTGVVGNADMATLDGLPVLKRPAPVGVMTSGGSVDLGDVDAGVLVADPVAPFGVRVDETAFLAQARRAIDGAELTILDPGEMDRAYAYGAASSPDQYRTLRREAVRRTDRLLGEVADGLPNDAMLLVLGITPPSPTWELTPIVAFGAGVHPGHLVSPSTQRDDLVTLTDVSATVVEALGLDRPDGMVGRPLEYRDGTVDLGALEDLNDVAVGRERVYYPVAITFVVVQAIVYLLAILVLSLGGPTPSRLLRALRFTVVTFAAWPLATFVVRVVPPLMTLGFVTHLLIWVAAVGLAALAVRRTGHPLAPLQLLAALTVAVLLVDVSTGSHLLQSSILGYSPHTSNRYVGFGNTAYAVLAPSALITAVLHVDRSARRAEALLAAGALLGLVIAIDGAPWLGSDVGGILSLVPVSAVLLMHLSGRRVGARTVVLAGLATAIVLAVAVGVDLLRSPSDRSHLANTVLSSTEDGSNLLDTLTRRWSANVQIFGKSVWTWMVPIIAVLGVYVLVIARGWRRLLPAGSALRAGVMGLFVASVLGWLVNDSGIVVTALFLVFIGPYLTLVVIADRFGGPQLLAPAPLDGAPGTGPPALEAQPG